MKQLFFLVFLLISDPALANRLHEAASRGSGMIMTIAQTTSGIGIAMGAILLSLGAGGIGRSVFFGGVLGTFATFGGPAIVDFLRSLF